jgi:glutathione S-transferase
VQAWEVVGRLRQYLDHLRPQVDAITDDTERTATNEWLQWCERSAAEHDPTTKPLVMPTIKPPSYTDLAEVRKWLGFSRF